MDRTSAPQSDQDTRPLAETGTSGIDRLRELEKLLDTARKVRKLADSEIAQGKNLERAQQRFDAANRMQRKVERELLKLRSELANEHPEVNQVWSPGDPVGRKSTSRKPKVNAEPPSAPQPGDFELSVMLGKDKARWNQPGTTQFDLDGVQSENLPSAARKPTPKAKPAPSRAASRPTASPKPGTTSGRRKTASSRREGRGKAWLLGILIAAGVATGAGLTIVFSDQSGGASSVPGYWDKARTWLEGFSDSSDPAAPATPVPVNPPPPEPQAATPSTATPLSSGTIRRSRPPGTGRILEQERRLQHEALERYESRLKQLQKPGSRASKGSAMF